MDSATDSTGARNRMVETQIVRRGVRDPAVLEAMRTVPREAFVSPGFEDAAYDDSALPIGEGQSISQPYIVAVMLEAAALKDGDRVLEIGAGSGYAAALLSRIAAKVFAIERDAALTDAARESLWKLGYGNIALKAGDGSNGWPEAAPFDAIIVSAGVPEIPQALKNQLVLGGRLVIPVGSLDEQRLVSLTRLSENGFQRRELEPVRFVRLIGASGWPSLDRKMPQA